MPHAVLGLYEYANNLDFLVGEDLFRKAVELDPRNTTAWLWYGIGMNEFGFFQKGEALLRKCIEIDPGYLNCRHHLSISLLSRGRIDEALAIFEPTLDADFHSVSEAFITYYVEQGNTLLATLLAHAKFVDSSAPVAEWIAAIKNPGADHEVGYARLKDWERNQSRGLTLSDIGVALLPFGKYAEFASNASANRLYMWLPQAADFRRTSFFKKMVRESRILEYWQARGFPGHCRAVGVDDFECDEIT